MTDSRLVEVARLGSLSEARLLAGRLEEVREEARKDADEAEDSA